MTKPTSRRFRLISSSPRSVLRPGMLSSLSRVPPVCPRALPDIMGTFTPIEAIRGANMMLTLSPTPPVECLSILVPVTPPRSSLLPVASMASVRATVSSMSMPFR